VPPAVVLVVATWPSPAAVSAARFPGLAAEPAEAVFATGDGLEPYRRLLGACVGQLSRDGAVAVQFHRRVHKARRTELARLRAELEAAQRAAQAESVLQTLARAA